MCLPFTFYRKITSDDDFSLYSVTLFKRVHDEFAQKLRENKYVLFESLIGILMGNRYILRDFTFDQEALEKQQQEFATSEVSEKELWV